MIHLHGWSHYSMLRSIGTPGEIIQKAKDNNQKAIAITDLNSGYGLLEFYEDAKDIKPILGTDIGFSYDGRNFMNIVLLAKNYQGYQNIIKLISIAHTKNIKDRPYLTIQDLKKYADGIIALSGGDGEIEKLITSGESQDLIIEKISEYENIFNGEFYLEFITYNYSINPSRKKIEDNFKKYIKEYNKKGVVTSNYRYIEKEDKGAYDVLLCIKNNRKYYDPQRPKVQQDSYIMSEEEVKKVLEDNMFDQNFQNYLLDNVYKIAESIDCEVPLGNLLFPKYVVPDKYQDLYKKISKNAS